MSSWRGGGGGGVEQSVAFFCSFSDGWAGGVRRASACLVGTCGRTEAWHKILIGIYGSGYAGE